MSFCYLVQESAYKTPVTSPTVYTTSPPSTPSAFYIRLDGSNAFTMRPRPVMVAVPYGGGVAIDAFRVADKIECKGRLVTKLYAGPLSQFLLQWAAQTINTAQTSPWTTTEPAGDLASVSCLPRDPAVRRLNQEAGLPRHQGRRLGPRSVSEDGTIATLTMELSASTPQGNQFDSSTDPTATTFPVPTDSPNQMPINPYVFIHASGGPDNWLGPFAVPSR